MVILATHILTDWGGLLGRYIIIYAKFLLGGGGEEKRFYWMHGMVFFCLQVVAIGCNN